MTIKQIRLNDENFPNNLAQIPKPPAKLYYIGDELTDLCQLPCVAIVGSRKVTSYGRAVTEKIAAELAGQGIVIVSGLALGVDSIAHEAALAAGGKTIAVLAGGLDQISPSSHTGLARRIIEKGGALISEYPAGYESLKHNFIARNWIISGLSKGVLITEAAERSGSLHTANFALEQGREVMAVPGNITSPLSVGTNMLIRTGATPIFNSEDVLSALGFHTLEPAQQNLLGNSNQETVILGLLGDGVNDGESLLSLSRLDPSIFNQTLTLLEITGRIKPMGSNGWLLR